MSAQFSTHGFHFAVSIRLYPSYLVSSAPRSDLQTACVAVECSMKHMNCGWAHGGTQIAPPLVVGLWPGPVVSHCHRSLAQGCGIKNEGLVNQRYRFMVRETTRVRPFQLLVWNGACPAVAFEGCVYSLRCKAC